jgi:YbbR domain-containing protein
MLSNPGYKLLSALLAVSIWWYVQGDEVLDAKVKARVDWTLPPDLVPTEPLPSTVTLSLRGTRAATRRAREVEVRVPVDLTDVGVGEHGLEFASMTPAGLPPTLEVTGYSPSSLRFEIDELGVRKVKIEAALVGDPAEGFRVEDVVVVPQVIEVSGPRSVVDVLREVRTQPIDVSGLTSDAVRAVGLDVPRMVRANASEPPEARITVAATLQQRDISGVQVHVWEQWDWRPREQTVSLTLEGPAAILRDIDPADVVAFVHLPDEPDRARYEVPHGPQEGLRLRVIHPGGEDVRVISVRPPRVTVERR